MTAEAKPKFLTCPLCKSESLKVHCESHTCDWYKCANVTCDAFISPKQRIAHRLNQSALTTTARGKRTRYQMSDTGWRERIEG